MIISLLALLSAMGAYIGSMMGLKMLSTTLVTVAVAGTAGVLLLTAYHQAVIRKAAQKAKSAVEFWAELGTSLPEEVFRAFVVSAPRI